ncbi:MAG: sarcosine oxidase subunit beta family protein [Pseudomonadota bacterium]|nr:sarcosine oxidase subunit beta family protein [Pseudomonadota bacterium]MED5359512.1 sarcosine oxidase subunit beta family protein [Pseudomonadota bacterium]
MPSRYSIFSLARNALSYHRNWERNWRSPDLKPSYDAVIVGGGGHGLATAYYLAKEHKMTNIAVLEKGWLGGGNTGRNTTIVRANYLQDESTGIYAHALKLWPGLSKELNYNVMFSPRGVMHMAHTEGDLKEIARRHNANRLQGVTLEFLTRKQVKEFCPIINISPNVRYPVLGASLQRNAGVARHDAVAWGYARGADARDVDIIQNCEVSGFDIENGEIKGVRTTRGNIITSKVGCVTAGHSSVLADMAGLRLPIESHPLQALVSEPLKPIMNTVLMSNTVHVYLSQSDKGELVIGAGADLYNSYAQRGAFNVIEHQMGALTELFPIFSRVRMMRSWGGIVDICPDASPLLTKTPIKGLYFNCGWGTGGFKATPGSGHVFAHTIAKDDPHPIAAPFSLSRFSSGRLIDENIAAAVAH